MAHALCQMCLVFCMPAHVPHCRARRRHGMYIAATHMTLHRRWQSQWARPIVLTQDAHKSHRLWQYRFASGRGRRSLRSLHTSSLMAANTGPDVPALDQQPWVEITVLKLLSTCTSCKVFQFCCHEIGNVVDTAASVSR